MLHPNKVRAGRKGGRPRKRRPPPPPRNGRPPLCTPEITARFALAYATGIGADDAAWCVGLHPNTVRNWWDKGSGAGAREPYRSFVEKAQAAEAKAVRAAARRVAADRALDWLQRVRRDRWHLADAPVLGAQIVVVLPADRERHDRGTVIAIPTNAGADAVRAEPGALQAGRGGTA